MIDESELEVECPEIACLDHNTHLVDPDIEVADEVVDDRVLDVLVDLLTLDVDVLLFACEV